MGKLVSVLMGVYNTRADFLDQAIASIIGQSYSDIEFVIVDDGSTDEKTKRCIEKYESQDDRIRIVRNSCNLGLTKALNIGLSICNGEYIARMDSDDISWPERIRKQVEFLDEHGDISLVGSDIRFVDDEGMSSTEGITDNNSDDPKIYAIRALIQHPGPAHPTFMFRTSFLRENGIRYNEEIRKGQDYGIIADILKKGGQVQRLGEVLLDYRIHSGQITASSEIEQLLYQSRTSFDYVRYLFSSLNDQECAAISTLGWYIDGKIIYDTIRSKDELRSACHHIINNLTALNDPRIYISAIKKMLEESRKKNLFDNELLEQFLRAKWWKKALRISKSNKKMWGFCGFTFFSFFYSRNWKG